MASYSFAGIIAVNIVLGITGSIAAYKIPHLVRLLVDAGHAVRVVMTESAKAFVTPMTLQTLSKHPVYDKLLDLDAEATMSHIALARWATRVLIAPASAHVIAKLTQGYADDLLTTLCLATTAPIYIAPAMNQQMWAHSATQGNVEILKKRGVIFLGPDAGLQACGDNGPGRMLAPEMMMKTFFSDQYFLGKRILISAGPTREHIDPVRYLSNRSSGKMGYALAVAAKNFGAAVTLISGPVALPPPPVDTFIAVTTAAEMHEAVHAEILQHDIFISAAAVSDYTVQPALQKIKRNNNALTLTLIPTVDILKSLSDLSKRPLIIAFAAETDNIIEHAKQKLRDKKVDKIIVNDVSQDEVGFDSDDNAVTIITAQESITLPKMSKQVLAQEILKNLC